MRRGTPRVLVVARSREAGEALCAALRSSGYRVALATSGRAALATAARRPPALVVQDIVLPDMDGETMIRALRALPGLADVPAIAMANAPTASPHHPQAGLFAGLLAKPVDPHELNGLIAELLCIGNGRVTDALRILLVDDDDAERRMLKLQLRQAGYEVTATEDWAQVLRLTRQLQPEMIVSEVMTARLDGFELALALRRDPETRGVPIILTAATSLDSSDMDLAAAVGATMLVGRSPGGAELLDAVAQCAAAYPSPGAGASAQNVSVLAHAASAHDWESREQMAMHLSRLIRTNAQLRERLAAQSVELALVAGLGGEISSVSGSDRLLDEVLARCAEATGFLRGAAYVAHEPGPLTMHAQVGFPDARPVGDFFGDPELLLSAVQATGGGIVRLPSDRLDRDRARQVLARAALSVLLVAPVLDGDELLGAIVLGSPTDTATVDHELFVAAIASQLGHLLSRERTLSALSRSQLRTVERLTRAAEFRDEETATHNERVRQYCSLLAGLSGMSERRQELIAAGSMMHDIGKLGIPDRILRKPGTLTFQERRHMERHPEYGREILSGEPDPLLDLAAVIAWTHHERWDGEGYPRRLKGTEIPLEGRIVAIGDVFDALTSDRVYRPAMTLRQSLELMQAGRGTQFDPHLLDLFVGALPQVLEIRACIPDKGAEKLEHSSCA